MRSTEPTSTRTSRRSNTGTSLEGLELGERSAHLLGENIEIASDLALTDEMTSSRIACRRIGQRYSMAAGRIKPDERVREDSAGRDREDPMIGARANAGRDD